MVAGVSHVALATETTSTSPHDTRIKTVVYNPDDVTPISGVVGVATHIVLAEGEEYEAHSFGDGAAWSFAHYKNHLFVKPSAENGNTNLTVITNKHTYEFALHYIGVHASPASTFQLRFRYPVELAKVSAEKLEKARVTAALVSNPPAKVNLAYTMSGSMQLAPVNVWNDDNFTYFKFPGNRDIPGIFLANTDGTESIVNRVSRGPGNDVVVVEKVAAKWVLRLGKQFLGVYNEAYDPIGVTNTTGTASPAVVREVKGDEK
jgi:type IV secretion system protein VirB9